LHDQNASKKEEVEISLRKHDNVFIVKT